MDEATSKEVGAKYLGYLDSIKNLLADIQGGKLPGIPEQKVADLNQLYNQAQSMFQQGIGAYQPYVSQGMGTMGAGIGTTLEAKDLMGAGANAAADVYSTTAGALPQYLQGATGYGAQAFDLAKQGTQAYDPSSYQKYMDPYQKEVIDNYAKEMQRQFGISQQQRAGQAIGAGAFGGGREGVYQAEGLRGFQDKLGSGVASLLSQGYGQAQQMAQSNFANQMARLQQAGQAGLGAGQLQLGAAGQQLGLGQLGLSSVGQQLGAAQGIGGLGSQLGALGQAQIGTGFNVQKAGLTDVGTMLDFANLQQQQQQQQLAADYANQMAAYQRPFTELGFLGSAFGYAPQIPTYASSAGTGGPSPLQQIAGYGIAGLSALSGLQGGGLF